MRVAEQNGRSVWALKLSRFRCTFFNEGVGLLHNLIHREPRIKLLSTPRRLSEHDSGSPISIRLAQATLEVRW